MNQASSLSAAIKKPFTVRVLRQDRPHRPNYWQSFCVEREAGMNVTSVLQRIAAHPQTALGEQVSPVAYDANV